jgi:hypothetical protein
MKTKRLMLRVGLTALVASCRNVEVKPEQTGVVDSVVPRESALARFQGSISQVDSLTGGAASRDQLVRRFVTALEKGDTVTLGSLVLSQSEFGWLYYPTNPEGLPPYRLTPQLMWFMLEGHSDKGYLRLLQLRAGVLDLDPGTGVVRVLGGTSLDDLLRVCVPQGWFLPVTPGTKFVTVGGAIASDVHGKDHHATGTFGSHVRSLDLALPDGSIRTLTPQSTPEEFWATCGGMGLTGTIVEATAGNTGLGLALVAAQKGYKLLLVVPDKMAQEKIFHLRALGTEVILTRSDVGKGHPDYYQDMAQRLAEARGAMSW